jgi:S1-C subfamily serine protease
MRHLATLFLLRFGLFGLAGNASTHAAAGVDIAELVRQAKPAILVLYPLDANGDSLGQGTGFFCNSGGYAFTNYHVVKGAARVSARALNGARYQSEGHFVRLGDSDVVLLRFKARNTPYLPGPSPAEVSEGQHVVVIGNPDGLSATVSDGIISATRDEGRVLQITAPVSPGSSGSPVLNDDGKLIGIVIGTREGEHNQNLNFAVSAKAIRGAANNLVEVPPAQSRSGPRTSPPSREFHPSDLDLRFRDKMQKITSLTRIVGSRLSALGYHDLFQEFLRDEEEFATQMQWLIHRTRLTNCMADRLPDSVVSFGSSRRWA